MSQESDFRKFEKEIIKITKQELREEGWGLRGLVFDVGFKGYGLCDGDIIQEIGSVTVTKNGGVIFEDEIAVCVPPRPFDGFGS